MGRRTVVLAVAAVLALVATSGTALAANIQGNGGDNRLVGTDGRDTISGGSGYDDIFGKGRQDRLFGDTGRDDVHGGDGRDRLQGGLGQDELYGQAGNDFVNAIDGQVNDFVDCGEGENDVAGIDGFFFGQDSDQIAENCENLYLAIPGGVGVQVGGDTADLSYIDTVEEAEKAEADGLLRQIR